MKTFEQTTGNAYTTDPDYNEFLGASKRVVRYDWTIRRWRWMVVSEPKTPQDRVRAANPDAAIRREKFPANKRNPSVEAANEVRINKAEEAHRILQLQIIAFLCDNGMTAVLQIAQKLEMEQFKVLNHLNRYLGAIYCNKAVDKRKNLWGVVGIHDKAAA